MAKLAERDEAPTRKEFLTRTKAMKKASKANSTSKRPVTVKPKTAAEFRSVPKRPALKRAVPARVPHKVVEAEVDDDDLFVGAISSFASQRTVQAVASQTCMLGLCARCMHRWTAELVRSSGHGSLSRMSFLHALGDSSDLRCVRYHSKRLRLEQWCSRQYRMSTE